MVWSTWRKYSWPLSDGINWYSENFRKKLSLWHFSKAGFPVSQNSYGKSPTNKIGKFYQEIAWIEIDNTNQQISGESLSPGKTWKLEMYESGCEHLWPFSNEKLSVCKGSKKINQSLKIPLPFTPGHALLPLVRFNAPESI